MILLLFSNSKNNCYIAPLDHVQFQDVHRRKLKVFNKKILFCLCPKFIFYACIRQFILQIKKLTNQKIVEKKPQGCEISCSITLVIYLQSRNEKMMKTLQMRINEFHTKYDTLVKIHGRFSRSLEHALLKSERGITL